MDVASNSDVRLLSGNASMTQESEASQRLREASHHGQNMRDWHPGHDPKWTDEMRATLHQPLSLDQAGLYTVQSGDCLRSIAERALHMKGLRATKDAIDHESERLIELNKKQHPLLELNPDYISRGDDLGKHPWHLRIFGNQSTEAKMAPAPPPPPVEPAISVGVMPEHRLHHPPHYEESRYPRPYYPQPENFNARPMPSPEAGPAIVATMGGLVGGLIGGRPFDRYHHHGGFMPLVPAGYNSPVQPVLGAYNYQPGYNYPQGGNQQGFNYGGDPGINNYADASSYSYVAGVVPPPVYILPGRRHYR